MSKNKFFDKIKESKIERSVEDAYNEGINQYFPTDKGIQYPFACDGYVDTKTDNDKDLKLIIEYKFNEMMSNNVSRAKVLVQVIYYIKKFEQNGMILPNVCMVGDKDECFVIHTNELIKYLDEKLDWSISPSNAATSNPDLVLKISQDTNINPFIFEINENFNFKSVVDKIKDLADDVQRYVHVTEHNISNIFDYFTSRVIKNSKKISPNDIVAIFIGVITDGDNYYVHPKKPNYICTPFGEIQIEASQYKGFISHFNRTYTPQEKMKFAEISDRLIEDTNRRNKGEFYTPTLFVDYAHKMISEALGDNWKDEYVVWDNCCGTKNLTRDYRFKELYCSTLENAELEISKKYNPEAVSFQFDFLNDTIAGRDSLSGVYDDKLPKGLKDALLENKPIVFLLNPPYAGTNMGSGAKGAKGLCNTLVNSEMKKNNMGACSQNLYAQFIYRLISIKEKFNLTNCNICIFCPTLFLTGSSWQKFRNYLFNNFNLNNAIQFNAGHFANVAASWGISFSIWKNGEQINKNDFSYKIVDSINGEIQIIKNKIIYNLDNKLNCTKWIKSNYKNDTEIPGFSSALNIRESSCKWPHGAIGYMYNKSNNVDKNAMEVALFSGIFCDSHGEALLDNNYYKVISLFSARKLIEKNWINSKDEYLAPNESHPKFQEFVNDSIVFSLFNGASNQSSLRNINYHNKLWDIKNEFFWMSKSEIESLANKYNNDDCYNDAHTSNDRFVYNKLQTITLSPEAKAVLDKASDIVRNTFKYRELFNQEHPEYQINNWDCGWYQIKALCKEYAKSEYDEFVKLYKKLADKMRPMVYTLGFLK